MRTLRLNKLKADKLCGKLVRARGKCEIQDENSIRFHQSTQVLQWGHIFTRSFYTIRWRLDNAFCICAAHHVYYTHRPDAWQTYLIQQLGEVWYDTMYQEAHQYKKIWYPTIMEYLNQCRESGDLWGIDHQLNL